MSDWIDVGASGDIAPRTSRKLTLGGQPIALIRAGDGALFAIIDKCPHKGGPLSDGIIHGRAVTCPLHNWTISLESGQALGADTGCTTTLGVKEEAGRVLLDTSSLSVRAA